MLNNLDPPAEHSPMDSHVPLDSARIQQLSYLRHDSPRDRQHPPSDSALPSPFPPGPRSFTDRFSKPPLDTPSAANKWAVPLSHLKLPPLGPFPWAEMKSSHPSLLMSPEGSAFRSTNKTITRTQHSRKAYGVQPSDDGYKECDLFTPKKRAREPDQTPHLQMKLDSPSKAKKTKRHHLPANTNSFHPGPTSMTSLSSDSLTYPTPLRDTPLLSLPDDRSITMKTDDTKQREMAGASIMLRLPTLGQLPVADQPGGSTDLLVSPSPPRGVAGSNHNIDIVPAALRTNLDDKVPGFSHPLSPLLEPEELSSKYQTGYVAVHPANWESTPITSPPFSMTSLRDNRPQHSRLPSDSTLVSVEALEDDSKQETALKNALSSRLISLACRIAKDRELRKAFTKQLSGKTNELKAQTIVDYLNFVLHEGRITERSDWIQTLRLLYKLAESAQVYPNRLLLRGIGIAKEPFEGGGFADVFKGKYRDHEVCIKVIRIFGKTQQSQILKTYIREIILWSHMSHENILPFYGVYSLDESSQRICLVSPLMQNGNLKVFLERNPEARRLPIIRGIVKGLSYLHYWNIIHGDLKAQNILVSNDCRPLITDFGLSHIAMTAAIGSTQLSAAGTTNWMAPELMNTQTPKPTKTSDMWSFGCLCYEMFTGKYPFYHCGTPAMVIVALVRGEIPIRPHEADAESCRQLDDWVWDLMLGCWRNEPEARYTCETIIAALATKLPPEVLSRRNSHWEEDKHIFWRAMKAQSKSGDDSSFRDVERIIVGFLDNHKESRIV